MLIFENVKISIKSKKYKEGGIIYEYFKQNLWKNKGAGFC